MSQRPFAPITNQPFKVQNYYLQLLLTQVVCKTPTTREEAKYTFSIYKGEREFQTTKEVTIPKGHQGPLPLDKFKLNFAVTSYNPGSHNDFIFKMILTVDSTHAKEIGEYILDSNQYIDQYNLSDNGAFEMTMDLNDDFAVHLELYVDRNQHGLFRMIRDIKNPKPKKENDFETPSISHQRIIERRRAMDQEVEQEKRQSSKEKRFTRFSPRKDGLDDKHKKEDFHYKKKIEEEQKKMQEEQILLQKKEMNEKEERQGKEKEKGMKKEPVVKPEWMIPSAEKYLKKKQEMKLKRKSSKGSEKEPTQEQDKTKAPDSKMSKTTGKKKSTVVEIEPTLGERLRSPPIIIALLLVLLGTAYFLIIKPLQVPESQIELPESQKKGGKGQKVEKVKKQKPSKK